MPPWLKGPKARTRSLTPILDALKTAAEAYEDTSLVAAEVVLPLPVLDDYLDALRSAMSSVSLQMTMSEQSPAGILAARAHGVGNECNPAAVTDRVSEQSQMNDHEPAQLILTVNCSDAALTVLLLAEECNVFEYRRVLHDTGLGADTISRTPNGSHEDRANGRLLHRVLEEILQDITAISPLSVEKCVKTVLSHFSLRQVIWRRTAGID